MPKIAKRLTSVEVNRLSHPGHAGNAKFAVGGVPGLMLQITPSGGKSWILRTIVGGKRRVIGLGNFPSVSLALARQKAAEALERIRQGVDPIEERKAIRAALTAAQKRGMTFDEATKRCLATKTLEFRNPKHAAQWGSTLRTYASPAIGRMLVGDVTVQDVLRVLQPIWTEKTETASRTRGRVEAVLSWATVAGHRDGDNPARWRGNLDALLPKPSRVAKAKHQPALALPDIAAWFAVLKERNGAAARALELATLCTARSGEVRLATWGEFDLDRSMWVIPAGRMKMGREHRVPLVPEAVTLVKGMPQTGSDFVFAAPRGGALTDMALSQTMRKMHAKKHKADEVGWVDPTSGRPAVPHGVRSTFRDWAAEHGVDREVAEQCLAHATGDATELAYKRSDLLARRRVVLGRWAGFLGGEIETRIVPIRGRK